jgi:ribosomal-protein-alanine N-acetyltransferase
MSEPEGRGGAWTEERGTSDEGRRRLESAAEASGRQSTSDEGRRPVKGDEELGGAAQASGDTASRSLRSMTPADIEAVLGLEHELFGEEAWSRQMLEGELGDQPRSRYYLVADDDGLITGYAGLLVSATQADVLTIAVAADRWGRGTGSALLEALLAEAARRGCTEVFLEVRTDNVRAQRLYQRYGFRQIGVRKGYYQPSGTDALVMRRDSAGSPR